MVTPLFLLNLFLISSLVDGTWECRERANRLEGTKLNDRELGERETETEIEREREREGGREKDRE